MGYLPPASSIDDFQKLLDRRLSASPAERQKIDAEIRERFERPMGIMITDMSGMTELTKRSGILDILAVVRRMQLLAQPVLEKHGGHLVKTVADDLFVVHESAKSLYAIARGLLDACAAENAAHPDADKILVCIGLGYGPVMFLGGEIWGDAVNVASKLGEDTAAGGEILVSEDFHTQIRKEGVEPKAYLIPESHRKAKFPYYSYG